MATTVQHPYHEHALIRKQLSENCNFKCDICTLQVLGTACCCEEHSCSFLHEPCALPEIPLHLTKHPLHPEHPLVLYRTKYTCLSCFDWRESCGSVLIATLSPLEETDKIQHVAHEHPLAAFRVKVPNWISCKVCQERIPGRAYGCHSCCFFIHESCARLPKEILQHPLHPEHPLTLVFQEIRSFRCKACHANRYKKLAYSCVECKFELDVVCAALPLPLKDHEKEDRAAAIDHFSHQHQLLYGHVEESVETRLCCAVCELKISGEVYYCLGCVFFLHKLCADELLQDMVHYLHPEHQLILGTGIETFSCNCCHMTNHGMSFHCASCKFNLHPKCAFLTSSAFRDGVAAKIQHFSHKDPLFLRYSKALRPDSCKACNEPVIGLAYRCGNCAYALHKSCAELPFQLEHPLHPKHPLSLYVTFPDKNYICSICCSELGAFRFYCTVHIMCN